MTEAASDIYQRHLDEVARGVVEGDLSVMARCIAIPNTVRTEDAELVIDSPEIQGRAVLDFREYLLRIGMTDYIRLCISAAYEPGTDQGCIRGSHRTYIIGSGHYLVPPYQSRMLLRLHEGQWQAFLIEHDVVNHRCTVITPALLRRAEGGDPA